MSMIGIECLFVKKQNKKNRLKITMSPMGFAFLTMVCRQVLYVPPNKYSSQSK